MRSIVRPLAVLVVVALAIGVSGVAAASKGDALILGVTTNSAQGFDTKLTTGAPKAGLWVDETGPGVALRGSAPGGGLAGRFDGDVQVNGACTGCLGRPGYPLRPTANRTTTIDSGHDVGQYVSATIGADGLGLISYYDATSHSLKVAHCTNAACTSATTSFLFSLFNGKAGFWTSIAIGQDGLGIITSTSARNSTGIGILDVTHCSNLACTAATTTALDSPVGAGTSIAIGGDGLALISYQHGDGLFSGSIAMAHCSNVACTSATHTTPFVGGVSGDVVGAGSALATLPSGIRSSDGLGVVTFDDTTDGSVWMGLCDDPRCATFEATGSEVAPGATNGAITVGNDGQPLIAVETSTNMLLFHCVSDCGSLGGPTIEPTAPGVSLTVGPDGLGLVASLQDNGILWTDHCNDLQCSGMSPFVRAEEAASGNPFVSLTTGADGLPLIAHYEASTKSLTVDHCGSLLCLPYFRRR